MTSNNGSDEISRPFMNTAEIDALCATLALFETPIKALEWGSGNSTSFFSSKLPAGSTWSSFEHDSGWHQEVDARLSRLRTTAATVTLVLPDRPFDGLTDGDYATFRNYVLAPAKPEARFDFILVDGRARVACMAVGWSLLEQEGIMVLHDAQRREYDEGIPKDALWLRMINPEVICEGPISIFFASRSVATMEKLAQALAQVLPQSIALQSNLPGLGRQQPCASPLPGGGRPAASARTDGTAVASSFPSAPGATVGSAHSCVFLNTYYGAFLQAFYQRNPGLVSAPYLQQLHALQGEFFGDSDFYSQGLTAAGWNASDLIINCPPLQQAWAREQGFGGEGMEIALEQVKHLRPDVVYVQDMHAVGKEFLQALRPLARLIVGQIASPFGAHIPLDLYDIVFTSFPHFVQRFRQLGTTAYYQPLAFEPRVRQSVAALPFAARPIDCSFVGGISALHTAGTGLLETLVQSTPIRLWGYGAGTLPHHSPLRERHGGEAWGREMFAILAGSRIAVNRHVDVAEHNANNMRLFEATGCGALLITDYKENLNDLFEIGEEVVAYRSPEECAALVNYYQAHPEEAEAIARRGQARTLRDHSYRQRMAQTAEILERHLRYQHEEERLPPLDAGRISSGHKAITRGEVTGTLTTGWQDASIPARQRALVQRELAGMYRGEVPVPFQALAQVMGRCAAPGRSVLEIGCASGYYFEILEYLLSRRIDYTGVDYSEAMIGMAKMYYPRGKFFAADGASLFFADRQFQTVISSCVLLHVPNYREHIAETARVAERFVVAARTPLCKRRPTQYLKKLAYGVETVELVFNEAELLQEFALNGFALDRALEYHADPAADAYVTTYLFKRA